MKIKTIICCALALTVSVGTLDVSAQKKSTKSKSKTTQSRSSNSTSTAKTTPVNLDFILDNKFQAYVNMGEYSLFFTMDFDRDNEVDIEISSGNGMDGNWSLSGNKLTITSGKQIYNLTSTDGGRTFTGTAQIKGRSEVYKCEMYAYNCGNYNSRDNKEVWLKALKDGDYIAYLRYFDVEDEMFFADRITYKVMEDEDDPYCGYLKLKGEGRMMEVIGNLDPNYEFNEDGLTIWLDDFTPDDKSRSGYGCGGRFWSRIGSTYIPRMGKCVIILDFYHKP